MIKAIGLHAWSLENAIATLQVKLQMYFTEENFGIPLLHAVFT